MSKERNSSREGKKKSVLTLKEKRAAKKEKKEAKSNFLGDDKK